MNKDKNEVGQNQAQPAEAVNTEGANARRDFLKQGAAATGALLSLSVLGVANAAETASSSTTTVTTTTKTVVPQTAVPQTLQLSLKQHAALSKVGGFEIVPIPDGSDTLIVAHTDATSFVACSAICPHRGCKVVYAHDDKEFVCPCHDSRFALDGTVLKGPAKKPLKNYATDLAAVVSLSDASAPKVAPAPGSATSSAAAAAKS